MTTLTDFLRREWGFTGYENTMKGNHVWAGRVTQRYTQTASSMEALALLKDKVAFDVSVVEPNSTSHANSSACNRSFLQVNVNSGTRVAEKTKNDSYKALCTQHGMTFVPVIFEHHKWGYGRTVPETAVAPTLEESRGEGPRNGHRTTGL